MTNHQFLMVGIPPIYGDEWGMVYYCCTNITRFQWSQASNTSKDELQYLPLLMASFTSATVENVARIQFGSMALQIVVYLGPGPASIQRGVVFWVLGSCRNLSQGTASMAIAAFQIIAQHVQKSFDQ